jgi:hypothetical protein
LSSFFQNKKKSIFLEIKMKWGYCLIALLCFSVVYVRGVCTEENPCKPILPYEGVVNEYRYSHTIEEVVNQKCIEENCVPRPNRTITDYYRIVGQWNSTKQMIKASEDAWIAFEQGVTLEWKFYFTTPDDFWIEDIRFIFNSLYPSFNSTITRFCPWNCDYVVLLRPKII